MAERRMFSKTIIDSDAFLSMPMSTQSLYFHLAMRADDDGFVNNPRKIARMVGAAEDDMRILAGKRYILAFESGVIVIKHWRLHNYIRKDRYKETLYLNEKAGLFIKDNGAYTDHDGGGVYKSLSNRLPIPAEEFELGQPTVNQRLPQDRLGKDRLGEVSQVEDSVGVGAEAPPPAPAEPPAFTLPLKDGSAHPITQAEVDEYAKLYPAVDILQELRKMHGWCDANPTRRKTKKGIKRFIAYWLASEQDRHTYQRPGAPAKVNALGVLSKMLEEGE